MIYGKMGSILLARAFDEILTATFRREIGLQFLCVELILTFHFYQFDDGYLILRGRQLTRLVGFIETINSKVTNNGPESLVELCR